MTFSNSVYLHNVKLGLDDAASATTFHKIHRVYVKFLIPSAHTRYIALLSASVCYVLVRAWLGTSPSFTFMRLEIMLKRVRAKCIRFDNILHDGAQAREKHLITRLCRVCVYDTHVGNLLCAHLCQGMPKALRTYTHIRIHISTHTHTCMMLMMKTVPPVPYRTVPPSYWGDSVQRREFCENIIKYRGSSVDSVGRSTLVHKLQTARFNTTHTHMLSAYARTFAPGHRGNWR